MQFQPVEFNPFTGPEIVKLIPTIEPQLEIWVSCILGGPDANRSYNESLSLHFHGPFDQISMIESVQEVIGRHEALRSVFSLDGNQICVFKELPIQVYSEDISGFEEIRRQEILAAFTQKDAYTEFDLLNGPLFRVAIFKLADEQFYLTLTAHHIICDGWSLGILLQDLGKIYSRKIQPQLPEIEQAPAFSQYATELRNFSQTPEYKSIEQYWTNKFADGGPVIEIPNDKARPTNRTYKSHREDFLLPTDLVLALKQTGIRAGCSFVTTILAAFEIFLHRKTNQEDIVLGLPAAGQSVSGYQGLFGHCVNLLPLRSTLKGELSFVQYLKLRKPQILDDFDHQRFTLGSLLKKLPIKRDPARVPLVPVVLNIDMGLDNGVHFENLRYQLIYNPREYETFEIFINATGNENSLILEWSYNTQLFSSDAINDMMKEFKFLLEQITDIPTKRIDDLSLIDNDTFKKLYQQSLHELEDSASVRPSLISLFSSAAEANPRQIALSYDNRSINYKDLNEQSNQIAGLLTAKGISVGDIIGISSERSIEMIITLLAILKCGASYLPIDLQNPNERITQILDNANVRILLVPRSKINSVKTNSLCIAVEQVFGESKAFSRHFPGVPTTDHDLIYILHTSGSTGKPKGVCMGQGALVNLLLWQANQSTSKQGAKTLQFSPLTFDVSFQEIFATLTSGGQLCLISDDLRLDPIRLLDFINIQEINRIFLPFVALQSLTENSDMINRFPASLEEVITAGEQLIITPQIIKFFSRIPKAVLYNQYGPTEAHVVSQYKLSGDPALWPTLPPIGRPISNTGILILNKHLMPEPAGVTGEICICGDCVAEGYLNLPEITAQKFLTWQDPSGKKIRIYRTGDLARMHQDGNIEFLGRGDDQIKIRGYRVELGEIEAHLNREKDIKQAVVNKQEDSNGNLRLIAYLTIEHDLDQRNLLKAENVRHLNSAIRIADSEKYKELVARLKENLGKVLPDYMIPYEFAIVDKLPLTDTGKVDKKALPKITQFSNRHLPNDYISPRTAAETFIAKVWADILGIEKISINSDFFELGGYSLIAVKVMVAIENETGRRLPLSILFENPTIEKLARMITVSEDLITWNSLVPIKTTGSKIPIYVVHGGGLNILTFRSLGKYMDNDQPVFGMQALGLNGKAQLLYSIEDIAKKYNDEILEINPDGPFALAGYSLGGFIAFEMAKHFKKMGKEVIMLGILDTYAGNRDPMEKPLHKAFRKIIRQFKKLRHFSREFLKRPGEILSYQASILGHKISHLFVTRYKIDEEFFTYEEEVNRSYDIAYDKYFMNPMDIEIDLFRVEKRINYIDDPIYLGWEDYATKGIKVYEVPGDHKTFLYPPNDEHFAHALQVALDNRCKNMESNGSAVKNRSILKAV